MISPLLLMQELGERVDFTERLLAQQRLPREGGG